MIRAWSVLFVSAVAMGLLVAALPISWIVAGMVT